MEHLPRTDTGDKPSQPRIMWAANSTATGWGSPNPLVVTSYHLVPQMMDHELEMWWLPYMVSVLHWFNPCCYSVLPLGMGMSAQHLCMLEVCNLWLSFTDIHGEELPGVPEETLSLGIGVMELWRLWGLRNRLNAFFKYELHVSF